MPLDDSRRIEREQRASVLHHEVLDLLLGGVGVDRRSDDERDWELAWRRTPGRPKPSMPEAVSDAVFYRDLERHLAKIDDAAWREIY